jgi:hypothetical protein
MNRDPLEDAALTALDGLYASLPEGFDSSAKERGLIESISGIDGATYGEILPQGSARMLRWLQLSPMDVLFDLGSGTGRLPLQAVATTSVGRAVGVELCPRRHGIAVLAKNAWRKRMPSEDVPSFDCRLNFVHDDLLRTDLSEATVVYLGATCFTQGFVGRVARRVAGANALRAFLVTKPLLPAFASGLETLGTMVLPMSWSPRVRVHVYRPSSRT